MSCDFLTTKGVLRKLDGDKISGKVYTFNGDTTGLETGYYNGIQLVMLADEYFDPNTIERIAVSVGGSVVELSKDQFWIEEVSDAIATAHVVLTEFQGATVPIALIQKSNDGSQKSFSVLADPKYNAFVARVKFADTIVPIDPKYLPGVCLPVVELNANLQAGEKVPDDVAAKMTACIGMPFILKAEGYVEDQHAVSVSVACYGYSSQSGGMHEYYEDQSGYRFMSVDGIEWTVV